VPTVHIRYMVNDVEAAIAFYTTQLGFRLISKTLPAFADFERGDLRRLLGGPNQFGRTSADIKMTQRYAHLAPDHLRSEMSRTEHNAETVSVLAQASAQEPAAREVVPAPKFVSDCRCWLEAGAGGGT